MLPKPIRNHGCGTSSKSENETFLIVLGGLSGSSAYLNQIMMLNMANMKEGWQTFSYGSIPYSNIIHKSFILHLDENRCDLMFVGIDGLYICKKNFVWSKKPFLFSERTKFSWSGIGRLQHCWKTRQDLRLET